MLFAATATKKNDIKQQITEIKQNVAYLLKLNLKLHLDAATMR